MTLFGIKSCDTCRKARKWLDEQGISHEWRDLREDGVDRARLERWITSLGPDQLVNRRSTTWRGLNEGTRNQAMDADSCVDVLAEHPTLIKRPVFETGERVLVGFNETVREAL